MSRHRGPTINVMWDIFPDALILGGGLRHDSIFTRILSAVTSKAIRDCDATVFLGENLRRRTEAKYGTSRRSVVIPVGADGRPFRETVPQPLKEGSPTVVGYVGQMGRLHDWKTILETLQNGLDSRTVIRFYSSGIGYELLKRRLPSGAAEYSGSLGENRWVATMRQIHVGLVSEVVGGEDVVMPSKTYSSLVAGQAVLGICSPVSDLANLIRNYDCGWIVEPGDSTGLRRILGEISANPAEVYQKRLRAYDAGHKLFDSAVVAKRWCELFHELQYSAIPAN